MASLEEESKTEVRPMDAMSLKQPKPLVEMRGFEPLTSCMRSKDHELHNLLKLLQHAVITEL